MPSGAEPSPLQLSGRRNKNAKLGSNIELNEVPYSFSDDNQYESLDEEELELAADKENLIKRIRKEMFKEKKKRLKKVRLSNDFITKKSKNNDYEEESAFYNNIAQQDDEYHEGDEFVLDMNEINDDDDDKGIHGDNDDDDDSSNENDDVDDNFGILGILNKNARKVM
jgi:hypothetical protein